jgi:hypothetical protein
MDGKKQITRKASRLNLGAVGKVATTSSGMIPLDVSRLGSKPVNCGCDKGLVVL